MINKHSIYNWLFFPLFVSLLAGSVASCINDPAMEEEDTSGKSTLSIMVRGITITDPGTTGSYDDYVKTLRVIGYDNAENVVCNQKWNENDLQGKLEGTGDDACIKITQTLREAFAGGVCEFYFIANEDGYSVYTNGQAGDALSTFLGTSGNLEQAPPKAALDNCVIAFETGDTDNGFTPGYPILMTVHSTSQYLKPGDNSMGTIQLVRCLAKLQLKVNQEEVENVKISNVKLTGKYADSYSLWDGKNYTNYKEQTLDYPLSTNGSDVVLNYSGEEIYLPETMQSTSSGAIVKYTFDLTADGQTQSFEIEVGKPDNNDPTAIADYNIYRNHWYTITGIFKGWNDMLLVEYDVQDWTDVSHEVQLSDKGTFEIGIPNIRQFQWDNKNYVATQYGEGAGAADRYATLTLRMTIPEGVKWQAHLDNPDFEFVGESDGVGVGENPQTPEEGVVTLRIRPVHTYTENERRTANLFVTLGTKPNEHALFITDANQQRQLCSDNGTEIRIIQVSSAEGDQIWTANP